MRASVTELPKNAVWEHFDGSGNLAHFYHANGFPLGVYKPLLSRLARKFKLSALHLRPTWPDIGYPPKSRDWQIYSNDLIAFIEKEFDKPIVGIGHSMGATCTVLAAHRRPDLFKSLILIEVAMLPVNLSKLARIVPKILWKYIEPAKSTFVRRDNWQSREDYLAECKQSGVYKRFGEESLKALAANGVLKSNNGQFILAFPKEWEAHNYTQAPNVMDKLERIDLPCLAIRGKPSAFFSEEMWQEWQKRSPQTIFAEDLSQGHLFPLENPETCAALIESMLPLL